MEQRFQDCYECAARLDTSMLQQGKAYRCAECGAVFRADREAMHGGDAEPAKPASILPRLVLAGGVIAGMLYASQSLLGMALHWSELVGLGVSTFALFLLLAQRLRKLSRDASGFVASLLLSLASALLALSFLGDLPENSLANFMLMLFAFGGLGGAQLAKFIRNRHGLPSVGPKGLDIPARDQHDADNETSCAR